VGVRPEDLAVADGAPAADAPVADLDARVEQVERLGAEDVVLCRWQGQAVRALLAPDHRLAPGQPVRLRPAPDKLLLFAANDARLRRWPDQSRRDGPGAAAVAGRPGSATRQARGDQTYVG
jgi:hypothetical protein